MTEAKHTPGPWRLDQIIGCDDLLKDDYHFIDAGKGFHCHETNSGFGLTGYLSEADAHLIAAAPDLLDAIRSIRDQTMATQHDKETRLNDIYDIAIAAIAKAEGQS